MDSLGVRGTLGAVIAFQLVVVYADGAYDAWDAFVSVISLVFVGFIFWEGAHANRRIDRLLLSIGLLLAAVDLVGWAWAFCAPELSGCELLPARRVFNPGDGTVKVLRDDRKVTTSYCELHGVRFGGRGRFTYASLVVIVGCLPVAAGLGPLCRKLGRLPAKRGGE